MHLKHSKILIAFLAFFYCSNILISATPQSGQTIPIVTQEDVTISKVKMNERAKLSTVTPDPYVYKWDYGPITSEILYMSDVGFVFCIDPDRHAPTTSQEYYLTDFQTNQAMITLLKYGFPHNISNLQAKYQLSDTQAYVKTGIALKVVMYPQGFTYFNNKHFNRESIESYQDPYINELIDLALNEPLQQLQPSTTTGIMGPYAFTFEKDFHELVFNETNFTLLDQDQQPKINNQIISDEVFYFQVNNLSQALQETIVTKDVTSNYQLSVYDSGQVNLQRVAFIKKDNQPLQLELNYQPELQKVQLQKKMADVYGDIQEQTNLSDFEFTLYKVASEENHDILIDDYYLWQVETKKTNDKGQIEFEISPYETYFVKETSAPFFAKVESQLIEITGEQLEIENSYNSGRLKVQKIVDGDLKIPMDTFEFGLYRKTTTQPIDLKVDNESFQLIDTQTTNANGQIIFENLDVNESYYLKELNAPDYVNIHPDLIKIDSVGEYHEIEVLNTLKEETVTIIKQDGRTKERLKNAYINLYDCDNNLVTSLKTNHLGITQAKLAMGYCYLFQEVQAPTDYLLDGRVLKLSDYLVRQDHQFILTIDNYPIEYPKTLVKTGHVWPFISWVQSIKHR